MLGLSGPAFIKFYFQSIEIFLLLFYYMTPLSSNLVYLIYSR